MLEVKQIEDNKNRFLELVSGINRDGISNLVDYLQSSDFFIAPASTAYHAGYEGGLCAHSLNVYDNLKTLVETYNIDCSEESVKIVSLFHDLAKVNFYEQYVQNKKLYTPEGSKRDDLGTFDWVGVSSYKTKDVSNRFVAGDHGFNSFMILSKFIPLSEEEIISIVNHHCGMDSNMSNRDMNEIMTRFPLASLLHLADMISVYVTENKNVKYIELEVELDEEDIQATAE